MKVILLKDVKNVGKKDEIVEVSDGYGRNYLLRNKLAVLASEKAMEILEKHLIRGNVVEEYLLHIDEK